MEEAKADEGVWSAQAAKCKIWREATKKTSWQHERSEETYARSRRDWESEMRWSKAERVDFVRFRVGHHLELRSYRKRIGLCENGKCRLCGLEEEGLEHVLLKCPRMEGERRMWGVTELGDLCCSPGCCRLMWAGFRRKVERASR